eukprot:TRINITY_DN3622_c0_g2_i1.p2 TRINITY_DN3622_c0_g2~~TRINITY_DN3622_c0_g2_i1.p2  ORF type:complete len:140 (+),score=47.38 TRINITY_DN3622_c0_g2_i1:187-606(+)
MSPFLLSLPSPSDTLSPLALVSPSRCSSPTLSTSSASSSSASSSSASSSSASSSSASSSSASSSSASSSSASSTSASSASAASFSSSSPRLTPSSPMFSPGRRKYLKQNDESNENVENAPWQVPRSTIWNLSPAAFSSF